MDNFQESRKTLREVLTFGERREISYLHGVEDATYADINSEAYQALLALAVKKIEAQEKELRKLKGRL